ncbi:MAG: R3H domain-containing nucleic acid-binding protein [Bacilli bacterium]
MKEYTAKTLEEAIANAAIDQKVAIEDLVYTVREEKKSFFKKVATIEIYEVADAVAFAETYIKNSLASLGIKAETKSIIKTEVVTISINSDNNPILIGKNGKTLQALTELTRLAIYAKFKKRYKLLLDINNYKYSKYKKITFIARKIAKEVLQTKQSVRLDPMTSDERRIIHNALVSFEHISTESVGEGKTRAIEIKYVD